MQRVCDVSKGHAKAADSHRDKCLLTEVMLFELRRQDAGNLVLTLAPVVILAVTYSVSWSLCLNCLKQAGVSGFHRKDAEWNKMCQVECFLITTIVLIITLKFSLCPLGSQVSGDCHHPACLLGSSGRGAALADHKKQYTT